MNPKHYAILLTLFILVLAGCSDKNAHYTLSVKNDLLVQRQAESVSIFTSDLDNITCELLSRLAVKDVKSGEILLSQVIDEDQDGAGDLMIFQPVLGPGETRVFHLVTPPDSGALNEPAMRTFSRFVPERTDDYAWENDRVAFRTYGPAAQKMVEDGVRGGTLTSGMDCWLKRVDYPIINKWYQKATEGTGSYHEDTGEGLDNFHVGASRGCGGTGIWDEDEKLLYTSENFTEWKRIAVGPLRTEFKLDYAPWTAKDQTIQETKLISLDLGSNLTKYEITIKSDKAPGTITAGLTLHEKDGEIKADEGQGWFSYWQPHGDSELGMGIVAEKKYLAGYTEHLTDEAEQSQLLVHLKPVNGKVVYYAGFGWKKSGQFGSEEEWTRYLSDFSDRLNSPLIVEIAGK